MRMLMSAGRVAPRPIPSFAQPMYLPNIQKLGPVCIFTLCNDKITNFLKIITNIETENKLANFFLPYTRPVFPPRIGSGSKPCPDFSRGVDSDPNLLGL